MIPARGGRAGIALSLSLFWAEKDGWMGQSGSRAPLGRLRFPGPRRSGRWCMASAGEGAAQGKRASSILVKGGRRVGSRRLAGALVPIPRHCRGHPAHLPAGKPNGGCSNGRPAAPHVGSNWYQAPRSSFRQNGGRHQPLPPPIPPPPPPPQEPCRRLIWRPPPRRAGAARRPRLRRRCSAGQAAGTRARRPP